MTDNPIPKQGGRPGPKEGRSVLPTMPDRLATRRRLLAWSSPLLALGLIGGPFLLGLAVADDRHRDQASDDPAGAVEGFAALADDTRFGPASWVSVYNGGTAALLADQPGVAVTELTRALEMVPEGTQGEDGEVDPDLPECLVRRNLSLSHETLAVESAEQQDYDQVTVHLTDALEALGACTTEPPDLPDPPESQSESESEDESEEQSDTPSEGEEETSEDGSGGEEQSSSDGGEEGEEPSSGDQGEQDNPNDEIQERQEQRMEQNRQAQEEGQSGEEDESSSGGGEGGEEETTSMSPQEQELQSRNREAEQDQRDAEQRSGGGYGGGQNW